MKSLLTIDWDFFVPEKAEYDLGHAESLLFLDMMWRSRGALVDLIKTNGAEKGFWSLVGASTDRAGSTFVSDSHAFAYGLLRGIDHVLLVDAHHDCWESDTLGVDKASRGVYCHNWLREWLRGSKKRRATWVRPEWSKDSFTLPEDMAGKVTIVSEVKDWGAMGIARVHACRSGCWTPPWLDRQFIEFVEARGRRCVALQDNQWHPLRNRWSEEDVQEVKRQGESIRALMRIGTMSSRDFLNGRVEVVL